MANRPNCTPIDEKESTFIRNRLIKAEGDGFTDQTMEEILAEFKDELRQDGPL